MLMLITIVVVARLTTKTNQKGTRQSYHEPSIKINDLPVTNHFGGGAHHHNRRMIGYVLQI